MAAGKLEKLMAYLKQYVTLSIKLVFFLIIPLALAEATVKAEESALGSTITFNSDGEEAPAYLVKPEGDGPFPAVIMIHEWWGLNDRIRNKAEELSGEGYVVLAVNLYRAESTDEAQEANELMKGLSEDRALDDLLAAIEYLKTQPYVKTEKIGVLGWSMGGSYSLILGINSSDIVALVVNYGRLVTDKDELNKIQGSVLGIFGEKDLGIPIDNVIEFGKSLRELDKEVKTYIYKGVGHGFANETSPSYSKKDADDAWEKTLFFLKTKLKR